ncbi:MAG: hypothetical protein M3237_16785 [Actinomycetota bacterium]|nr:hypothetical protein [Actinomycetota bacterium]
MAAAQDRRRFIGSWVLVLTVAGCVWWGIHPPRDPHDYREESARTLQMLRSHVETARLWAEGVEDGRVLRTAASVGLTETSTDADAQSSRYSSLVPSDRESTRIWRQVSSLSDEVASRLSDIRLDARVGRWHEVVAALPSLARLSDRLGDLEREVRR